MNIPVAVLFLCIAVILTGASLSKPNGYIVLGFGIGALLVMLLGWSGARFGSLGLDPATQSSQLG